MKAFLFWYKTSEYSTTEYVYVIAVSEKQAIFFWSKYLRETLGRPYDYIMAPCGIINQKDFVARHEVGDILGQYAYI